VQVGVCLIVAPLASRSVPSRLLHFPYHFLQFTSRVWVSSGSGEWSFLDLLCHSLLSPICWSSVLLLVRIPLIFV
jgi:hypothetical protein